jgi:leucyl-tRNA synthetase
MPIIFYNIIKKEVSYALPDLFLDVTFVDKSLDIHHNRIRRCNNNLMDMDRYIQKFGCDSIRLLVGESNPDMEMIYDTYHLEDLTSYIQEIKRRLLGAKSDDVVSLDYYFHKLIDSTREALDNGNILKYVEMLKAFNDNVLFKENISKSQAFDYIRVIYPIFPSLAEEVYSS